MNHSSEPFYSNAGMDTRLGAVEQHMVTAQFELRSLTTMGSEMMEWKLLMDSTAEMLACTLRQMEADNIKNQNDLICTATLLKTQQDTCSGDLQHLAEELRRVSLQQQTSSNMARSAMERAVQAEHRASELQDELNGIMSLYEELLGRVDQLETVARDAQDFHLDQMDMEHVQDEYDSTCDSPHQHHSYLSSPTLHQEISFFNDNRCTDPPPAHASPDQWHTPAPQDWDPDYPLSPQIAASNDMGGDHWDANSIELPADSTYLSHSEDTHAMQGVSVSFVPQQHLLTPGLRSDAESSLRKRPEGAHPASSWETSSPSRSPTRSTSSTGTRGSVQGPRTRPPLETVAAGQVHRTSSWPSAAAASRSPRSPRTAMPATTTPRCGDSGSPDGGSMEATQRSASASAALPAPALLIPRLALPPRPPLGSARTSARGISARAVPAAAVKSHPLRMSMSGEEMWDDVELGGGRDSSGGGVRRSLSGGRGGVFAAAAALLVGGGQTDTLPQVAEGGSPSGAPQVAQDPGAWDHDVVEIGEGLEVSPAPGSTPRLGDGNIVGLADASATSPAPGDLTPERLADVLGAMWAFTSGVSPAPGTPGMGEGWGGSEADEAVWAQAAVRFGLAMEGAEQEATAAGGEAGDSRQGGSTAVAENHSTARPEDGAGMPAGGDGPRGEGAAADSSDGQKDAMPGRAPGVVPDRRVPALNLSRITRAHRVG